MQELTSIGTSIATLIAILVAVASTGVVAWAGWQYVTAAGDPQAIGKAKQTLIGAFIGLGIAGLAFIGPRIFIDLVIKPVGGVTIETEAGLNCDSIFRNQLTFQRGASTKDRMNVLVSQIQSQQQECDSEVWNPTVVNLPDAGVPATVAKSNCYGTAGAVLAAATTQPLAATALSVGDSDMPFGLLVKSSTTYNGRPNSGRDSENNIILYFASPLADRPSDGASCWLYYSRLKQWHENYY